MLLPCVVGLHCSHVRGCRGDRTLPMGFSGRFAHRETCTGVCFYFPSLNTPHGWLLTPNANPRDPPPKVGRELSLAVDMARGPPGAGGDVFFCVASPFFPAGRGGKRPGLAGGAWEGRQRGKRWAEAPSLPASCLISTSSVRFQSKILIIIFPAHNTALPRSAGE